MKKLFVLAATVVLAVGFVGCAKEDSAPAMKDIKVEFSVADKDGFAETRAVKNAWADGDKIMIFFKVGGTWLAEANSGKANTITLTYNDGSWSATKNNWSETLSNSTTGKFSAIHYRGEMEGLGEEWLGDYYFVDFNGGEYLEMSGDYTITDGVMTLPTLTMKMPDTMVQFSVKDLASNNKEWELLVNFDTEITTVYDPTASDGESPILGFKDNIQFGASREGQVLRVNEQWMANVVNGADRSFVGVLDGQNDEVTTKYVFVLKNVEDYEYYKFEYAPSTFAKFEGRTAYLLPPLTLAADGVTPADGCKWTLLQ